MVKQGSFFQRLKERWGSGSGVRVDNSPAKKPAKPAGSHGAAAAGQPGVGQQAVSQQALGAGRASAAAEPVRRPDATASRVEPVLGGDRPLSTSGAPVDVRSSRKMSDREEAMLAVGAHFQELTALLRGSQARTDEKLQRLVDATSSLGSLPQLGEQQLAMLKALSSQMEKQNQLGEQLSTTMTKLPSLLQNVEAALDRAAKTDERTAQTVREFQSTMDRIHTSMDKMVQSTDEQAKAAQQLAERRTEELEGLAKNIASSQQGAVEELRRANDESLQSLRRTHEDQSNRLQRVVQESAGWNRAVLVGIGLIVLGLGAVIVLQLVG